MINNVTHMLSPLQRRVLAMIAEQYVGGQSADDALRAVPVHQLLRSIEYEVLLTRLRGLSTDQRVQLKSVCGRVEHLIVSDLGAPHFGPTERAEAYLFLVTVSDTVIPDD